MELMVMTDGSLRDASGKSYAPDQFPNAKSVDANALGASGRPRWQDFALGSLAPSTDNATRLGRLEEYQSIFQSPKPRAGVYNTGAAQTDTRGQGTTFGSLGRSFQSGGAEALASIGTMFNEDWDDVAKSVRQVHAVDDTFLNNSVRGLGSFAPMAAAGLATGGLGAMAVGALQAGGGARGEIRDARLAGQDVSTWDAAAAIGGNMVLGAGEAALQMAIMKGFSPVSGRLTQQITGRGITNAVTRAALPMMAPGAAKTVGRVAGRYVAPGLAQFGGAALLDQASEQVSNVGSNLLAQNFYDPGRGAFDGAYETFEQSWLPSAFSAGAGRVNAVNRHSMDRRQRTLRGEAEIGERKSETMSRERRLANGLRVEDAVIVSPEKKTEAHKVAEAMAYNATGRAPAYYTSSSPRQAVIINEGTKAKPKLRMYINAADPDTTAIHEAVHGVSGGLESEATARLEQLQAQADIAGQGTELYMARVQSAISFTSENLERLKASTPVDEKGRRVKEYSIPRMEADLAALIKVGQRIASNPNIASEEGVAVAAESSFGPAERQSLLDNTPGAVKRMWDRVRSLTAEGADRVENERIQRQIDLILEPIARNTIEARKQMRTEIETLTARRTAREDSGISGQFASEGQIGRELVPTTNPPAPFDTSGIPTPEPAGKFRSPESDDSIYREINRTIAEQEAEISRTDIDLTQQAAEQRAQDMDADTGYRAMRQDALADQGYQQSKQNPQPTDAQLRAARMATAEYDRNQRMRQDAMARAEAEEYARGERSEMDRMQEDVDSVKLLIQQDTIGRRQAEADAAIASEQEVLADQGYRAMRQDAAADQGLRAAGQDRAADTGYERAMIGNTQAMLAERMNRGRLPRPQAQMNPEMLADATQDVVARQRAAKMEPPPVQAPAPTVQPPQVDTLEDNGRRFSSDNAVESWLTDLHRQYKDSGGTARKALGMLRLQYDERVGDQYKPSLEEEAAKGDKAAKVALKWAKQSGLYWTPIYPRVNQGGDVVGMQGSSAQQPAQNVQNQDQQAQPQQQQIADAVRPEGGDDQKYTKQARGATTKKLIETLQWINERPISEYKPADAADLAARKRVIEEELKRRNDGGGTPKAVKQGRKRTGKAVPVNIDEMTTAELRKVAGKYGIEADEMTPRGKILDGLRTVEQAKGKPFTDRDVKFSIAGEKSISNLPDEEYQTARYNLKTANAMEREGLDNEKIRMATGWFKQPDGKWRYEIDDSGMKIALPWFEKPSDLLDWTREMPLSGLIEHPSLFEAYPRLDRLNVYFRETHNPAADISARYDGNITLYISSKREASVRELRSSLLHEIQHAIQEIEGFSRGASPSEFLGGKGKPTKMTETARKMIEGGQVEPDKVQSLRRKIDEAEAINAYQNVLGEREARNVEARIDMTPEQRRATPPDYGDGADVKFSIRANEAPARIESADDLRAAFYAGPGDRIEQLRGVLYDDGTFAVADASGFQHTDINRYWGENKREVSRFFLQQDRTGDVMAYFPDGTKSVANHPAMKRMGFRVDDETMATVSSPDRGAKFSIRSDDPDAMRGVSENMGRGRTSPTNAPQRPGSGNKAYQQGRQAFEYYGRADLGKKARAAQNAKLREAGLDPLDPSVQQAFRQGIQDAENERTAGRDAQRQSDVDAMDPWGSAYRDSFGSEWLDMTPRRRREIIESDIEAHNTERAADEYKQLTIEQRFARGIETHIDRQDAITDALERSGIPLVDTSGDSKYFRIGDAKIRISNHDPKPTHERQFGAATIDINTSDDRRAMATHHTGGMTFEQIADLVRQLRKSFNPSAPAAPGGTPRFSIASTAGIPEGKLDDPKHIATATAAWKEKGTESPWFKRWFKDSKVVDGEGKPMVVYHGTAADFTTFDSSLAGRNFGKDEPWHFFSSDPEDASLYARHAAITTSGRAWKDGAKRGGNAEDGSAVVAAYVSLRNPLVIEGNTGGMGAHYFVENKDGALPKIISALKSGKYDGVITRASDVKTPGGVLDQIVIAKLPEQIKSVNNRGTFDDANPDVRFSVRAGEATAPENIKDTANNAIRRAASGVANLYDKLPEGTRKAIARQFTQAFQQTPAIAAVNEAYEQESLKTESDREAIIRIATKPARTEADLDAADRILRGHPLDIDDVTPELLAAAKMGRDEWRQKAQELSREMQALGLTARDEWMNAERYWYPNIWSKHNVRSVMGRLYAVATGGRKLTASEAGHQKARTTDRFTVVNSKTGKIMPGGIFASRADAEAFMAAAGGEKPHYIKYRFRDNDGKMKDALETFSTIHEARRAINSHMEDGLIRNDDDIKIMDFGKKPPLRIMEPMTVEQQRAHGLVEDVATNFRLGVASAQSLVAKVRFFNNLYGAVKDTDIFRTSADLEVNPSNEYVRVKDLGLKLPDKIDNANIRALMDGAVRRDLADDLAGMFGERNGLFWKLSEFGKELDRISGFRKWVTYRNPFRYVKQFPENEIMMYIADAKAFADVKTRATAIVEFVNWARSKQTDSPFMQEFAESGLLKTDFLHGPEIAEAMHLLNKRDGDPIARHDLAFKGIAAIADKAFGKGNVEAADNFAKTVYGLQDAMYKYQLYNAYRSRGVDAAAAQENVRKYMFDWDHAPRLVKSLQFIPFAPSVLWQFSRIFGNKMKADPAGFSMKLGLTIGGLAMLRSALMGAFGVDEEDREKMAWYEFPLPMTDSNGRTMTIDSRWMVPFQDVARFVPGDAREFRALWRSALPMTAQPVATLATQQTRFGRPIIYDNEEGKAGSVMAEAMLDAAPGLLGQYWRAQYRNATRDDKYGQDWWVAAFTRPAGGISARPNPVSIPEAYKDAASPVRREKSPERPEFARWAAAIDREKDVAAKLTMQEEFVEAIKADALPARWRVENEMAELAAKSTAYNAARQSLQDRRTDRTEAMEAIKKNRLSAAQSARLARLRAIDRQVSSIEKRVKSGVLTADAAKRQIDRLLRSA